MFFASFHATALKSGNKHYSSTSSPSVQNGHHRRFEWLTTRKKTKGPSQKYQFFFVPVLLGWMEANEEPKVPVSNTNR